MAISERDLREATPANVRRLAKWLGLTLLGCDDPVTWVQLTLMQRGPR